MLAYTSKCFDILIKKDNKKKKEIHSIISYSFYLIIDLLMTQNYINAKLIIKLS